MLPGSDQAELTPRDGQLEIKVDEQVVADFCYWNAGWGARARCSSVVIAVPPSLREARVTGKSLS